jgi:flagellar hook protein FlgE
MGVFSAFSVALSALQAESSAIDTTGNNLANLNTTGFKGSNVDFRDMVSQAIGVGTSATSVGLGVMPPLNVQQFTQGSIQASSSTLDCAIEGNGFFIVNNASGAQLFTRDGSFKVDANGTLETQTGEDVQGWTATASGLNTSGAIGNIVVPAGTDLPPVTTQNATMDLNLDASATVYSTTDTTSEFSQPIQVYDSLGQVHTLNVTFEKKGANDWTVNVTIPGADVGVTTGPQSVGTGELTFDPKTGLLLTPAAGSPIEITISGLADGATFDKPINLNLYNSDGTAAITQYAQPSSLTSSTQDGSAAAQMTSIAITDGGQVMATFSNGQQKVEGQLALADIRNPDTLKNVGDNEFVASGNTAQPAIGTPQTGGRGQVLGSSLEASNVDMATQITNLIVFQRGYEAATKVISTADTITQDLINLIR